MQYPEVLDGPFINRRFLETWLKHYDWGAEDGAALLSGRGRITPENKPASFRSDPEAASYGWPTVWEGVKPRMKLFQTEIFGPTVNWVKIEGIAGPSTWPTP